MHAALSSNVVVVVVALAAVGAHADDEGADAADVEAADVVIDAPTRPAQDRRPSTLRVDSAFSLSPRLEPSVLQQDAYELFLFPYGTTGEPYLEFAPDSPAFWGVVKGAKNTTWRLTDDTLRVPAYGAHPVFVAADVDAAHDAANEDEDEDANDGADCGDVVPLAFADVREQPGWARFAPVVDVGAGVVSIDSEAVLFAVFRDGVEHDAPAGFVRRTFQGHVDDNEGAAIDRNRATQMPWAVVQLRFDLDRVVGGVFDAAAERRLQRRRDARADAIAGLLDARAAACAAAPSLERALRVRELNDLLVIFSRRNR